MTTERKRKKQEKLRPVKIKFLNSNNDLLRKVFV